MRRILICETVSKLAGTRNKQLKIYFRFSPKLFGIQKLHIIKVKKFLGSKFFSSEGVFFENIFQVKIVKLEMLKSIHF